MKYAYGPVNSRRLGLSLGLSLAPYKACNFDCVYCQLTRIKEILGDKCEII
jgi:wyosine [tRNA(Phe)-imidazoG37] synthetase (radical SAM superfamily)